MSYAVTLTLANPVYIGNGYLSAFLRLFSALVSQSPKQAIELLYR